MNRTLRFTLLLLPCFALLLFTGACSKRKGPPQRPPATVKTELAVTQDSPVILNAFGNTEDRVSIDVVPQVSGMLVGTFIQDGARVTNGQALFQVDSSDYVMKVRQGEGLVAADRVNLELNRLTLERNRPLFAKSLISQETFDTLKAKMDATAAQLQMDEAALDLARLNLARCTVTSTVVGVCSKRFVDNDNLVAAGQTRLTNIRNYDPLTVEFSISEQYVIQLRQAFTEGPLRITLNTRGDTNTYEGVVTFLDNTVNVQNGTLLLRGEVANPTLKLWAGQFVEVNVTAGMIRNAVMIPESALQFGKRGPFVYVVTAENKAEMRVVKPGVRYQNRIQVIEGVQAGEKVVALGQLMLYPGASVAEAPAAAGPGTGGAGAAPTGRVATVKGS